MVVSVGGIVLVMCGSSYMISMVVSVRLIMMVSVLFCNYCGLVGVLMWKCFSCDIVIMMVRLLMKFSIIGCGIMCISLFSCSVLKSSMIMFDSIIVVRKYCVLC